MCHIIVDSVDEKRDTIGERAPGNALKTALVRYLASTVPSITLKTGNSDKTSLAETLSGTSSLGACIQAMHSGSPLVFVDVYDRPNLVVPSNSPGAGANAGGSGGGGGAVVVEAASGDAVSGVSRRAAIIEEGKRTFSILADDLLAQGRMAWLDVCTVAFFNEALNGDGDMSTEDTMPGAERADAGSRKCLVPLWRAVKSARMKVERGGGGVDIADADADPDAVPRATADQVHHTAAFVAERYFRDAHSLLPPDKVTSEDWAEQFAAEIDCMTVQMRSLFSDANFHHLNLTHPAAADRLVSSLVKLDRLPKENPLEALLLLRRAWSEYDVCVHLSGQFKLWGKLLFAAELAVAFSVVCVIVYRNALIEGGTNKERLTTVTFTLSMITSLLISFSGYLEAKPRWRQLRSSAGALESIIWQFRARSGPFAVSAFGDQGSSSPERVMQATLSAWMEQLVSGANLNSTTLERAYPSWIYTHHQLDPEPVGPPAGPGPDRAAAAALQSQSPPLQRDDHHSPVTPDKFIELRLEKAVAFYKRRIPAYGRRQGAFKVLLLLLAAGSSLLAYLGYLELVVLVTAAASALTSWCEFSDMSSKVQRYNGAVQQVKLLLTWWETLTDVEKAGVENIDRLITRGEAVIGNERVAWQATAAGSGSKDGEGGSGRGGGSQDDPEPGGGGGGGFGNNRVHPKSAKDA